MGETGWLESLGRDSGRSKKSALVLRALGPFDGEKWPQLHLDVWAPAAQQTAACRESARKRVHCWHILEYSRGVVPGTRGGPRHGEWGMNYRQDFRIIGFLIVTNGERVPCSCLFFH